MIVNAGPGPACNGDDFSDLFECCTEEHQCGLYQGACSSDSQCEGNLKCGSKNCNLTSSITTYAGNWQKFNCCINGMSIRGKNSWFVNNYFTLFCLEQQSLSCHESNLDDVEECEQADSPCMTKKIGKTILSLLYVMRIKLN